MLAQRAAIVSQLLKAHGITKLLPNRDRPNYVEPIQPVYEAEEIEVFFEACNEQEGLLYLWYLLTGLQP